MRKKLVLYLFLAAVLRYFLIISKFERIIRNRVEISTPLNSFKRVQEGAYLYKHGINPYSGDLVHEVPTILLGLSWVLNNCECLLPFLFIALDLLTAFFLYEMTKTALRSQLDQARKAKYAPDTEDIQLKADDVEPLSHYVMMAYLFNPFSVASCVAQTATVFSNFFLSLYFFFLAKKQITPCMLFLAIETMRNMYPVVLLAPAVLQFSENSLAKAIKVVNAFLALCGIISFLHYFMIGNWSFFDSTLGFIFHYRDLQPNIGVFWYFFTEMFEHFRTMFLVTFQMNATILYLVPLSIKLRKDPMMLATILLALIAIFRSYPCVGDIAFYLAFLPLWKKCWKFMAQNFIVFCFFLVTVLVMPTLWHLWIYAGSANANFYFGITLGFCTGQIFLVTDLLFAHVKREFCLKNGQKLFIDGKEAKIILE